MSVRYKATDKLLFQYYPLDESSYGNKPSGTYTLKNFGFVQEVVPTYDPELQPVWVFRSGSEAGLPLMLRSKKKNIRLRVSWLQPTMTDYVQKELFTDGDNLYAALKVEHDVSHFFYVELTGLKCDVLTIRGSIGEVVTWIMEMIGKSMNTSTSLPGTPTHEAEPSNMPWEWNDVYLQYDIGSGYGVFPDLTDFEIRIEFGLKPIYVFNASGLKDMEALEQTVVTPSARLTANMRDKEFIDYLIGLNDVDLKLTLPDSKYIELKDGKFRVVDPGFRAGDELISQRLEFVAKSWAHNFT